MARVRVYQVQTDVDVYQSLLPVDFEGYLRTHPIGMRFFGSSIALSAWKPPSVFSEEPELPEADFWGFGAMSNTLVVRPQALAVAALQDVLLRCGQLLPLPYRGEPFALFNVTSIADALDDEQSSWAVGSTGKKLFLKTYAFRAAALPRVPLFKLPTTTDGIHIWATEGVLPAADDFKHVVEHYGLTGLIFKEAWSERE